MFEINVLDLNEDVLLHILSFLGPTELHYLQLLKNTKLSTLVDVSLRTYIKTMVISGTQCFPGKSVVPSEDRLRVHCNWLSGECEERKLFDGVSDVNRVRLKQDKVYINNCGEIRRYDRSRDGSISDHCSRCILNVDDPTIVVMVSTGDFLFTGTNKATCSYIYQDQVVVNNERIHFNYNDVLAMEFSAVTKILASSNFKEINIYGATESSIVPVTQVDWRAKCMKMDANGDRLVVGNICTDFATFTDDQTTLSPLTTYDMNTFEEYKIACPSSGILDVKWHKSPDVLLTAHWNGDLRIFDLRSYSEQLVLEKPGKEDLNCSLAYDGEFGVVCGYRTEEVALFDLRQPKSAMRLLNWGRNKQRSYMKEIQVDPQYLIMVNHDGVRVLDYS